jgi:demethylmenaquinone methyltransferase/2-methoxy-6-polyprenyl-1,4-benzoquinol methylase
MSAPPGPEVQAMFSEIAPRYDFLNRFLSFGIDRRWRRRLLRELNPQPGEAVLDLCCGTGDLALAFQARGCAVTGADFTLPMLVGAQGKPGAGEVAWVQADAQDLPFADATFAHLTIAFGIRNVEDPPRALRDCARVLRPGGRLAVLEFHRIPNSVWRGMFRFYFHRVLPLLAKVVRAGRTGAYTYLPESVDEFATPAVFRGWLEDSGFVVDKEVGLSGGVARLFLATRAGEAGP